MTKMIGLCHGCFDSGVIVTIDKQGLPKCVVCELL